MSSRCSAIWSTQTGGKAPAASACGGGHPGVRAPGGHEQFKVWYDELKANLDLTRCDLLEPVYLEFSESFVVRDSEFEKLMPDNHKVDLYLITYRVPGIERLGKPISMINLGPTPIDLIAYYRELGWTLTWRTTTRSTTVS